MPDNQSLPESNPGNNTGTYIPPPPTVEGNQSLEGVDFSQALRDSIRLQASEQADSVQEPSQSLREPQDSDYQETKLDDTSPSREQEPQFAQEPQRAQRPSEAVPYDRFQQVNTKLQEAQEQARLLRDQNEQLQKASAAGFTSYLDYQRANEEAKRAGYQNIEQYNTAYRNNQAQQQFAQQIDTELRQNAINSGIDPYNVDAFIAPIKQQMLASNAQTLAARSMMEDLQRTQNFTATTLKEQAITNAKQQYAAIGAPMDPVFESTLRNLDPATIAELTSAQVRSMQSLIQNSNGKYAIEQERMKRTIPPMGTGGAPPPPMQPQTRQQQQQGNFNPANSSFADAMNIDLDGIQRDWEKANGRALPR